MAKETKLNETAQIYQPRDNRTEKEKWLSMTPKERWSYFNAYYRNKTILLILCIGFVVYLLYSIFGPKVETVLYTAIVDGCIDSETASKFQNDMTERLQIDPKKSNVFFDDTFYISNSSEYAAMNQTKLSAFVSGRQLDLMIVPESLFSSYATQGFFAKMSDVLPTQLFSNLTDHYFYDSEEDQPEAAYGIYLDDYSFCDSNGQVITRPVLGIIANSKYTENAVEFIEYLDIK